MAAEDFIPLFPKKTRRQVETELLTASCALSLAAAALLGMDSCNTNEAKILAMVMELISAAEPMAAAHIAERIAAAKEAHDGR